MGEAELFNSLRKAVVDYDEGAASRLAKEAIGKGLDPVEAVEKGLMKGMQEISDKYTRGDLYLPELVMAGDTFDAAMKILEPVMLQQRRSMKKLGTVVFGTVFGDLHDIGKNLTIVMMRTNGFEVHDLGKDQPVEAFVDKAREVGADIVAMSAMISTTRIEQRKIIEALRRAGIRAKTMVGGAMVDEAWMETIGADAYGRDMLEAVVKARGFVGAT